MNLTHKQDPFAIETRRLVLRRLTLDDADLLLAIFSDPVAMRYYDSTRDRDQTLGWIRWNLAMYEQRGHGMWAAFEREGRRFVGQIGLVAQEVQGNTETELGYLLQRSCWGRGFATEAARGCRDFGFRELDCDRLVSLIDPLNEPSRSVATRVGMRPEREIEKWGKTVSVYSLARDATIVEALRIHGIHAFPGVGGRRQCGNPPFVDPQFRADPGSGDRV